MPVNGLAERCKWKFRNIAATSRSAIQEFLSSARMRDSTVGSQNEGTQTLSFKSLAVASYTSLISDSPFGTAKYLINDLMWIPDLTT
mmetsp:Transcript_15172/g.34200  ORF Transcript_15172/g.34200 Transcript_15172/m.34200 type:complete len:87 (+) Transcript_15172:4044-4304(+)